MPAAPLLRVLRRLAFALVLTGSTLAQAAEPDGGYRRAPAEIHAVLDAVPAPSMRLSPTAKHVLFARTSLYPPIAELAAPMLKLAGVRIDPENNAGHGQRHIAALSIRALPDARGTGGGEERKVALPAGARIDDIVWNPAGTKVAFTNATDRAVELWILDVATAKARKVPGLALNPMLGAPAIWMPDGETLLVRLVGPRRGPPKARPAPVGPRIESSEKGTKASSTYEARDLLRTPHDADLFEYYGTAQLATVSARGKVTRIGAPAVFTAADPSPDGRHLLVARIVRPYSFTRPFGRFPHEVEIWDTAGRRLESIASVPLADKVPVDGVRTGPREFSWRPLAPATLMWAEALDGGDTYRSVDHHDRVVTKVIGKPPTTWLETTHRFGGIAWLEDGKRAMVYEVQSEAHRIKTTLVDVEAPSVAPKVVWDRSYDDRYGDPGTPVTRVLPNGESVVRVHDDAIFLAGRGATPEGDRPFLDRMALDGFTTDRWFRSPADRDESFGAWVDVGAGVFLTRRETETTPANLAMHMLSAAKPAVAAAKPAVASGEPVRSSDSRMLTSFEDPAPQLRTLTKQLVKYQRADGVPLSFTMYLPPGYRPGTPMPTVLWAYPLDYTDAKNAGQVTGSVHEFTSVVGPSPIFLALAGYVVLDQVAMPVVGPTESAYDTFLPQIEANARAAIDKAVELGVTDRDRVGVLGHSHGGLMTANLLAWTDLFRAGVARSGAYNHTTRPFGFQNERRSLYQAKDNYLKLSPLLHADQIDEPLLIIHGEVDANPGTVPQQSEKLFEAVRGTGGTTRLLMLPHESHGYVARESVEHVLAETIAWFDAHVKNAGPRPAKAKTSAGPGPKKAAVIKWKPAQTQAAPAAAPCDCKRRGKRRRGRRGATAP
jgi:dipeptidyl aminopeptidase/acylaminoacyl peptidase